MIRIVRHPYHIAQRQDLADSLHRSWRSRLYGIDEAAQDILSLACDKVSVQDMDSQQESAFVWRAVSPTGGAYGALTAGIAFAPPEASTTLLKCICNHHTGGEAMDVREIMVTDIESVDRNDTLLTVEERMAAKQFRHLPVLEQGDLVGIVTQRDLFKAAMSSAMGYGEKAQQAYLRSVRVKEIMTYPVITISPDTSLAAAAEMIITKGIGCLPVVDGTTLVGMITKTDLLRCLKALDAA